MEGRALTIAVKMRRVSLRTSGLLQPVAYYATLFHPAPVTIPNPAIHQVTFNENAVELVPTAPMEQDSRRTPR